VLLHNFFQSHLLMKLAVILNIYHKPHAITNSRTQSYRTQAHFVTGNLAAIMPYHGADTNRHTHTHLLFQWGVYVCFWHALWPLNWPTISRAAGEVWLPVIQNEEKKNDHSGSTGVHTNKHTHKSSHHLYSGFNNIDGFKTALQWS